MTFTNRNEFIGVDKNTSATFFNAGTFDRREDEYGEGVLLSGLAIHQN